MSELMSISINVLPGPGSDPTRIGEAIEDAIRTARGEAIEAQCRACGAHMLGHDDLLCEDRRWRATVNARLMALDAQRSTCGCDCHHPRGGWGGSD